MNTVTAPPIAPLEGTLPYAELRRMAGVSRPKADRIRHTKAYAPWFADGFINTPQGVLVAPQAAEAFAQVAAMMADGKGVADILPVLEKTWPLHGATHGAEGEGDSATHGAMHHAPQGEAHGAPLEPCTVQAEPLHGAGTAPDSGPVQAPELDHLRELVSLQGANLTDLRRELDRAGEREREAARTLAGERRTWLDREGRLLDALTREQEGMMALTKALAAGDMARLVEVARDRGIPTHGLETVLEASQRPASGAGDAKTPEEGQRRPWWRVWGGRAAAL